MRVPRRLVLWILSGDYLKVDDLFWCEQEPYFSQELLPVLRRGRL